MKECGAVEVSVVLGALGDDLLAVGQQRDGLSLNPGPGGQPLGLVLRGGVSTDELRKSLAEITIRGMSPRSPPLANRPPSLARVLEPDADGQRLAEIINALQLQDVGRVGRQ